MVVSREWGHSIWHSEEGDLMIFSFILLLYTFALLWAALQKYHTGLYIYIHPVYTQRFIFRCSREISGKYQSKILANVLSSEGLLFVS